MSKNHFKLPDKPDDPVPKVVDSMQGTAMWEVSLAAPEGECNIVQGPSTAHNSVESFCCFLSVFNFLGML